jgi:hypothetical protein
VLVQKIKPLGLFSRRELIEVARQRYLDNPDPDNVATAINTNRGR